MGKGFGASLRVAGLALLLAVTVAGCVTTQAMQTMTHQELQEAWRKNPIGTRMALVEEMERRKAVPALLDCLTRTGSGVMTRRSGFTTADIEALVLALGRVGSGDPLALDAVLYVNDMGNKTLQVALVRAYAGVGGERAARASVQYLTDEDQEVRWQALDTLGRLGAAPYLEQVKPLLFDDDANIRWKAVYVLGTVGGDGVVDPLSLALADRTSRCGFWPRPR